MYVSNPKNKTEMNQKSALNFWQIWTHLSGLIWIYNRIAFMSSNVYFYYSHCYFSASYSMNPFSILWTYCKCLLLYGFFAFDTLSHFLLWSLTFISSAWKCCILFIHSSFFFMCVCRCCCCWYSWLLCEIMWQDWI